MTGTTVTSWRILVHALDRTGPPMLALALVEWMRGALPADPVSVVAFRGGDMADEFPVPVPVHVMLRDEEAWDHRRPDPTRVAQVSEAAATLAPVDVTLLVSVAAGQALPYLPGGSRVVAWVVEQGEDLHWLDAPLRVDRRVDRWLAGSDGTRHELRSRLGEVDIEVAPEFVRGVESTMPEEAERTREQLGVGADELLVLGAGIGTHRKAPDLFLELALAHRRLGGSPARFVWVGGQRDPLVPLLVRESERLGMDWLSFHPPVADLMPFLAAADVFAHTARLDAFPLVCLHAAVASTPVVAFDGAGGVPEMLGESFRGVPFPDVCGLARTIIALDDPAERRALAARQHRHVVDRYTTEVAAPVVVDLARSGSPA